MASKTIAVSILADTKELQKNLGNAEGDLRKFGDTADREARTAGDALGTVGDVGDTTATRMSTLAGAMGDVGGVVADKLGMPGLAAGMENAGTWMMGLAGIGDIAAVSMETLKNNTLFVKVATAAKTATDKIAAGATKAYAAAQAGLNAVMAGNPIALLVLALVAVGIALVVAYKKSETFRNIVNGAFNAIKNVVSSVFPAIKTIILTVLKVVATVIRTYFNIYKTVIMTVVKVIKAVVSGAFHAVKSLITGPLNSVVSFIGGIPGRIKALGGRFKDAGSSIMHKIVDGIKGAAGFIGNVASGIWKAVKGMLNQAIDKINTALEFKVKLPLGKSITINPPNIPHLATGGIVTSPTLALIGEAGPEAVVPLNGRYGNGNAYYITVKTGPVANPVQIGKELKQYIAQAEKAGARRAV
jgi:phage-related protein